MAEMTMELEEQEHATSAAVEEVKGEEELDFDEVEKLQDHGINVADIKKLKAGGIHTIAGIMMVTTQRMLEIKGISEAKVSKIIEAARKIQNFSFITASALVERRKNIFHITTGSSCLDEMLEGGFESMSITEIFGEARSGKSQLVMTLCVTSQLPKSHGGGNGKVIYIDTENTFRGERVAAMARRFGVDPEVVLQNIVYARAYTHEHQMELVKEAAAQMLDEHFALLIIDSATGLFRSDFIGRGMLADRQQKLGQLMARLQKISEEFNVAVVVTNQVVSDPGGGAMFMADTKKPIGGNIMAHASTTRLQLKKGRGNQRICKVFDSPALGEVDCTFALAEGGVVDADVRSCHRGLGSGGALSLPGWLTKVNLDVAPSGPYACNFHCRTPGVTVTVRLPGALRGGQSS
eukprot:g45437.t1